MNPQEFCREKGYGSALLLTYDFDPLFFERVVLRNLWLGQTGDITVLADPSRIGESSARWPGQLRSIGRKYQLVPALTRGAFHPKVILRVGDEGGAIWMGSGNVTYGGWGGNRELGVAWTFGPGKKDGGAWLAPLLERISEWCPPGLQHDVVARVRETTWVQSAAEGQAGGDAGLLTSYGGAPLASQLARRWAGRRFTDARVFTGSTDESGAFLRWLHGEFGVERARVVVSEGRCDFVARKIAALPLEAEVLRYPGPAPMHAKFIWLDGPDGAAAAVGSANCSAAAWFLDPDQGGNVEAVLVYDRTRRQHFGPVLSAFDSDELIPLRLNATARRGERGLTETPAGPTLSEVVWEEASGELRASFGNVAQMRIEAVTLEAGHETVSMHPAGPTRLAWVAELPQLFPGPESAFVDFEIRMTDGSTARARGWVNDLTELRHASRGRRIAETLLSLARVQSPSEQQRVISALQRVGVALLTEPESFPDPMSFRDPTDGPAEPEGEGQSANIDPDDFVRSVRELRPASRGGSGRVQGPAVSLLGVMRALFGTGGAQDADDETDSGLEEPDTEDDDGASDGEKRTTPPKPPFTQPEERYVTRLYNHMDRFLENLASPEFSERCTATQLVQAAAYPVAVATLGLRGDWVYEESAAGWIRQACDALFNVRLEETGLLATVRARYAEQGREADFRRVVGDGTLWLALLSSLGSLEWGDGNGGLEKALALRAVYSSRELIASGRAGRVGALLGRMDEEKARAVLRGAPEAVRLLGRLEADMLRRWDQLMKAQETSRPLYEVGDLLWNPKPGWAEVWEETQWGYTTEAYLHIRADSRPVSSKFFLNVTKAAGRDAKLAKNLETVVGVA